MQSRTIFRSSHVAAAVVALAALVGSASSFARGGEALDIELPSMRTPVAPSAVVMQSPEEVALASTETGANASFGAALTRKQVRQQLELARANGTLSVHGEAGDTPRVLAAREAFNAAQGETLMAAYLAEQRLTVALAEAEQRRTEIEAEGQLAQMLALGESETLMPNGGAAIESDGIEVRVDVIDMQTSAATPSERELVIVSLDGGDAASQHAQAMHARRQLGAMGLSQGQIYIESADARSDAETVAAAEGDMDVAAFADGESDVTMAADGEDN